MTPLTRLVLATEMLLNARWILNEELGLLVRSEAEAAIGARQPFAEKLNRTSDLLEEFSHAAGASVADAENMGDRMAHSVSQHAGALVAAAGRAAAEHAFLHACAHALREFRDTGAAAGDAQLASSVEDLLRALHERVQGEDEGRIQLTHHVRESIDDLVRVWRSYAFDDRM